MEVNTTGRQRGKRREGRETDAKYGAHPNFRYEHSTKGWGLKSKGFYLPSYVYKPANWSEGQSYRDKAGALISMQARQIHCHRATSEQLHPNRTKSGHYLLAELWKENKTALRHDRRRPTPSACFPTTPSSS